MSTTSSDTTSESPEATRLRLTLVQTASATAPKANRDALRRLDVPPAELVVLPEYFHREPGRPDEPLGDDAEDLDGPFVSALVARAAEHGGVWVAGVLERSADADRPHNTLVAVDGTGVRAAYRKIHLYDSFGYQESDRLSAGDLTPVTFDVEGLTVGLMTCYDLRFPELARELARRDAELLLVPAAWVAGPRKVDHWRTLLRARAIENVCYVAGAAQPPPRYTGHTMLIDPRGDVLNEIGDSELAVVTGEVVPQEVADARAENPSLANRRHASRWG